MFLIKFLPYSANSLLIFRTDGIILNFNYEKTKNRPYL